VCSSDLESVLGTDLMDQLVCTLENDFPVTVVRAIGEMSFASVPALRRIVHKGLTDHPALLLIDVSAVAVIDDITVTVFTALVNQGAAADVPVMLVGPAPPLAAHLDALGIGRTVSVHPTEASARQAFASRPPRGACRWTSTRCRAPPPSSATWSTGPASAGGCAIWPTPPR